MIPTVILVNNEGVLGENDKIINKILKSLRREK